MKSNHASKTLDEKTQEAIFEKILNREGNKECADCGAKGPRWASLDFGIICCMNCAGAHRALGPSVTRVKSTKLDAWLPEWVELVNNVGNKLANDYYEYQLPRGFKKPQMNSSQEELKKFVVQKYVKKEFSPSDYLDPIKEYLQNKNKTQSEKNKSVEEQLSESPTIQKTRSQNNDTKTYQQPQIQPIRSISQQQQQQPKQAAASVNLFDTNDDEFDDFETAPQQQQLPTQQKQQEQSTTQTVQSTATNNIMNLYNSSSNASSTTTQNQQKSQQSQQHNPYVTNLYQQQQPQHMLYNNMNQQQQQQGAANGAVGLNGANATPMGYNVMINPQQQQQQYQAMMNQNYRMQQQNFQQQHQHQQPYNQMGFNNNNFNSMNNNRSAVNPAQNPVTEHQKKVVNPGDLLSMYGNNGSNYNLNTVPVLNDNQRNNMMSNHFDISNGLI